MFALAIPALTALWVLTEYYEEHTWPSRIASEPHVAGTWDPWLFFVAGIWLIILVIHALRTYLGPPVGPIGRYIRWPMTPAEVGREVERLKPVDGASQSTMRGGRTVSIAPIAGDEMRAKVDEVLNHWPAAGLAVGVVRDRSLAWFHGHGVADVESGTPVDADTRLPHRLDLQDDHGDRGHASVGAGVGRARRPPTTTSRVLAGARQGRLGAGDAARHLLTHTAGVRAVRRPITGSVHRLHLHADLIPTSLRPTAVPARRLSPVPAHRRSASRACDKTRRVRDRERMGAPHTFAPTDAFAVFCAV